LSHFEEGVHKWWFYRNFIKYRSI